ncbi:MAG: Uma2 family endonuclease [Gammaproteobacteria bacterium]|nr:Uma2 family endonuclease [Gammaproteobacteria bacterium]
MKDESLDFFDSLPESKLELDEGRLIAGNGLAGSKLLLRHVLEGWGSASVISPGDGNLYRQALQAAYPDAPVSFTDGGHDRELAWADKVNYAPEDLSAGGAGEDCEHWQTRDLFRRQLYEAAGLAKCGSSFGRDFVMRLGNNGFTPDVFLCRGPSLNRLSSWYLDGAADLVIEVVLPAHANRDRVEKRRYYEAGGVPEYWIVDPERKEVELLRLTDGRYQPQQARDGRYCPPNIPELVFLPDKLWLPYEKFLKPKIFEADYREEGCAVFYETEGPGYGSVPFAPRIALEPVPVRFDEFISWCPEAKIEGGEDRLEIGDTRKYLGLSLMTFGLTETVKLLHPRRWLTALMEVERDESNDAARKAEWWKIVRKAAALLRGKFGPMKLAVTGDLLESTPLNFWSKIMLVGYDLPEQADLEGGRILYEKFNKPGVYLIRAKHWEEDAELSCRKSAEI